MFGIKFTRRVVIGLILIYLSGLGYAAELIIPFTHIPGKLALFSGVLVLAEICFFAGVAVLGKPLYKDLKRRLTEYVRTKK